jgi:hypothetical protein
MIRKADCVSMRAGLARSGHLHGAYDRRAI